MFIKVICVVLFACSAVSRTVPNFKDLDEDDQALFRAAYDDAYTYHQEPAPYHPQPYPDDYSNEISINKLDLLKDGIWALKAKMKELKAFNKALVANLLATKLQVKELVMGLKVKKLHVEEKPSYNYQPPPSYPQHAAPQPQYPASAPQYPASAPQYPASAPQPPQPLQYAPAYHYEAPPQPAHDPYHGH